MFLVKVLEQNFFLFAFVFVFLSILHLHLQGTWAPWFLTLFHLQNHRWSITYSSHSRHWLHRTYWTTQSWLVMYISSTIHFFFLDTGLTMKPKLASNSRFSCQVLLSQVCNTFNFYSPFVISYIQRFGCSDNKVFGVLFICLLQWYNGTMILGSYFIYAVNRGFIKPVFGEWTRTIYLLLSKWWDHELFSLLEELQRQNAD